MKTAIVSDTFPPDINGVAMTLERLAAGLISQGHEVEVVHPGMRETGSALFSDSFREVCVPGFPIPRYPFSRLGLPRPKFLKRRWSQWRPDAVYMATEGMLGISALHAARALGIPVVSGYHTHFPQYLSGYRLGLLEPVLVRYLRRMHNSTRCTLVPTEEARRQLAARGFRNLEIMERGVDTELFHPVRRDRDLRRRWGAGPADMVLIYVGRLAAEKNLAPVFEAWASARAQYPGTKLVIAGDGPQRAEWEARAPEAIFTGFLTGTDLASAYASADLLLFPSLTETFGNVLLEGMASGVVTVSYHLAASRRFVEPGVNGYAATQESPSMQNASDAFVRQVFRALRERRGWAQMAEAACRTVRPLSWDHIAAAFACHLRRAAATFPIPLAA